MGSDHLGYGCKDDSSDTATALPNTDDLHRLYSVSQLRTALNRAEAVAAEEVRRQEDARRAELQKKRAKLKAELATIESALGISPAESSGDAAWNRHGD